MNCASDRADFSGCLECDTVQSHSLRDVYYKNQAQMHSIVAFKNVGLCGGFRFLGSGFRALPVTGFRGFRFLGRPARHGNSPIDLVCKVIGGVFYG